jgi:molecular chaperone HtpG
VREQKPEEYRAFFDEFGGILKEGIFLDHGNREKVAEVCLWSSLNTAAASDRITHSGLHQPRCPSGQDEIYYITGAVALDGGKESTCRSTAQTEA